MLETLSVRPRICDQIRSGPLGRWVDDFVDVLMTRGYATGTVRACRRMSSATLPRCTCSRPASTWRPSRCGSATSDSKPPINTSRRTCNSRKTLCENSSRSVNERSGSRPTPRCWPSWRASDYDKQTTCWTPTATVSPTVTCHNAMLVILTETGLGSTARCCGRRQSPAASSSQQRARVLTGVKARRFAPPPLRGADGLDAGSAHARPDWLLPTMLTHTPPTCCGRRPVQNDALSGDR